MRKLIYVAVFFAGMTSLGTEMLASRLLERTFGMSNLVWASVIGLILIYLALGYFLGGAWADRSPSFNTFYKILIWSAVTTALLPVASRPVLQIASLAFDRLQAGPMIGAFLTTLLLLVIPTVLLGTTSPFAIRLVARQTRNIGSTAGKIYAVSTLGSFIGTFLPVLLLMPTIGTYRSFFVFSAALLAVALIGLGVNSGWKSLVPFLWTPLLLVGLFIWGLPGSDRPTNGQIYEGESSYNYIQVVELNEYRYLLLNESQGYHSIYHPKEMFFAGPWEEILAAPFFNPAPYDPANIERIAIIGLAAGTSARQATYALGPVPIDGFELDEQITLVGRELFDMNLSNLNVILQDGRWGLEHSPYLYQIISIDAYRPPYIPWHLTTREFFQIVYEHLAEDGVMVINVGRLPNDRRMVDALAGTIQSVFPSIYIVDIPDTLNTLIYASHRQTQEGNLADNLEWLRQQPQTNPLLLSALDLAASNLQPLPHTTPQILTDDLAPVEQITNQMIIDLLFNARLETVQ
jgi:spermidine synthase